MNPYLSITRLQYSIDTTNTTLGPSITCYGAVRFGWVNVQHTSNQCCQTVCPAPQAETKKSRLQLFCVCKTCGFYFTEKEKNEYWLSNEQRIIDTHKMLTNFRGSFVSSLSQFAINFRVEYSRCLEQFRRNHSIRFIRTATHFRCRLWRHGFRKRWVHVDGEFEIEEKHIKQRLSGKIRNWSNIDCDSPSIGYLFTVSFIMGVSSSCLMFSWEFLKPSLFQIKVREWNETSSTWVNGRHGLSVTAFHKVDELKRAA